MSRFFSSSTDNDWKRWGDSYPYFGVISDESYFGSEISESSKKKFYRSGESYVKKILDNLEIKQEKGKKIFEKSLDFGCGVGRITYPLAKYSKRVVGLDIAQSMIDVAMVNKSQSREKNIVFLLTNSKLTNLPSSYSFLHSYIVFQHIPPSEGVVILRKLLMNLEFRGYFAIHLTHDTKVGLVKKTVVSARQSFLPLHYLLNVLKGRPLRTPRMKMFTYNLDDVLKVFYDTGLVIDKTVPTNHGGYIGTIFLGRKRPEKHAKPI